VKELQVLNQYEEFLKDYAHLGCLFGFVLGLIVALTAHALIR
jgi:hypothetical protein